MVFSFLTQELAIDLGTANTVIFMNDKKIIDEPSIVAVDNLTGKVLAVGTKAKQMQGKESKGVRTIRPLKEGVIADFDSSEQMIRAFIKMINTRRSFFSPSLKMVVCIPSGSTPVETRAVRDAAEHSGGRDVYLIFEPMELLSGRHRCYGLGKYDCRYRRRYYEVAISPGRHGSRLQHQGGR